MPLIVLLALTAIALSFLGLAFLAIMYNLFLRGDKDAENESDNVRNLR